MFQAIGFGPIDDQVRRHPLKARLIAPLGRTVRELFDAVGVAQELLSSDTQTLCHGGCNVANTFSYDTPGPRPGGSVCGHGGGAGLFDWQLSIRICVLRSETTELDTRRVSPGPPAK